MSKRALPIALTLLLALLAAPGFASAETAEPTPQAVEMPTADLFSFAQAECNATGVASPGATEQGTIVAPTADCSALCCDDTEVSCSGSSCSAVDASCPSQRGYCWGSSSGYQYCPSCSSPQCTPPPCPAPCSKNLQCTDYCGGPGFCSGSGCCIC
jgi:hypothetical protein